MNGRLMRQGGGKLKSALRWVHDLFFPRQCVGCSAAGAMICQKCLQSLQNSRFDFCPGCNSVLTGGHFCQGCRDDSGLAGLFVLADFHNQLTKNIVHAIKYDFVYAAVDDLSDLIRQKALSWTHWPKNAVLTPVPLYFRRQLWRGFNQSLFIARAIGLVTGNKVIDDLLVRCKNRKLQVSLNASQRAENMINVFFPAKNKTAGDCETDVVVVDDVYTTGSTMKECAKVLKSMGFKNIWGAVLAKD